MYSHTQLCDADNFDGAKLCGVTPSHGGLEVERWSDNRTDSASVGSNPALEMLCRSSSNRKVMLQIPNFRAPGRKVYNIGPRVLAVKTVEIAKAFPLIRIIYVTERSRR